MALYDVFSYNVKIQYKSHFFSKATLFTVLITILNILLPLLVAYQSKGFWMQSHYFYEQPSTYPNYDYLLIAETDDPSVSILCGQTNVLSNNIIDNEEYCAEIQIAEEDYDKDGVNDALEFNIHLIIPRERTLISILMIIGLDIQIKNTCSLQMQSLAIVNKEFSAPPNAFKYHGDLHIYQSLHLPCFKNIVDMRYNFSMFNVCNGNRDFVNFVLHEYMQREVISTIESRFSKTEFGHIGTMDIKIILRVPEVQFRYIPSLLQEFKYAWPQYLALAFIIYHLFNKIKQFIFTQRILMAWKIVPWKKYL